jgi:hypothetical protein
MEAAAPSGNRQLNVSDLFFCPAVLDQKVEIVLARCKNIAFRFLFYRQVFQPICAGQFKEFIVGDIAFANLAISLSFFEIGRVPTQKPSGIFAMVFQNVTSSIYGMTQIHLKKDQLGICVLQ